MSRSIIFYTATIALAITLSGFVTAQSNDPINERVARLEKTVLLDANKPDGTVLARLEAMEKKIKDDTTPDDLKKAIDIQSAELDKIDRRLKAIEARRPDANFDRLSDDLKKTSDELTAQRRDVRDLMERVKKIENIVR